MSFLRKRILLPALVTILVGLSSLGAVNAELPTATKQPINQQEFMQLFKKGEPIKDRAVPSHFITDALRQERPKAGGKGDHIVVMNSVIEDDLDFGTLPRTSALQAWAFQGSADFSGTTFLGKVDFNQAKFDGQANFSGATFQGKADFYRATFHGKANFSGVTFQGRAAFDGAKFQDEANFSDVTFQDQAYFRIVTFQGEADLSETTFRGKAYFNKATAQKKVWFYGDVFQTDVFFNDLNTPQGSIVLSNANFHGQAYFDNAKISRLSQEQKERNIPSSPVNFEKQAVFYRLRCDSADFSKAEFRDYADFREAQFTQSVEFRDTTFKGDVNFDKTEFPPKAQRDEANGGCVLEEVRFLKRVDLHWDQIGGSVNISEKKTLGLLKEVFQQATDLKERNEAMYQLRLLARTHPRGGENQGWALYGNWFSWAFWGYEVRPWRLGGWILVIYLLCTALYWTQTKPLAAGKEKGRGRWERLKFAFAFSWLTSWKRDYGYQSARTPLFKVLTLLHSVGFKLMVLCLLHVFSNISPLLNALVGKLLPL